MTIIDTHSHLASRQWLELLKSHGGPRYDVRPLPGDKGNARVRRRVGERYHPIACSAP